MGVLDRKYNVGNFGIRVYEGDLIECFGGGGKLVYLTGDA